MKALTFSINQGQNQFLLTATEMKASNVVVYKVHELLHNGDVVRIEDILGYSDRKETYFEEFTNGLSGHAYGEDPLNAVMPILNKLF